MLVAPSPSFAYLGWVGQGNLGDESILQGQRLIHSNERFLVLPAHHMSSILKHVKRLRPSVIPQRVLLGGGTVIGRPEWLERLRKFTDASPGTTVSVWGAGVEDPNFVGHRSHATSASISAWREVLSAVDHVGVRGPRSAELLSEIGVSADVVGDPALALTPTDNDVVYEPGSIALNIADPEDSYSADLRSSEWATDLATALAKQGHAVYPFAMENKDIAPAQRAAAASGNNPVYVPKSPEKLIDWLAEKETVISQRLHGSILAAAAGTPFISLDYRPKCADFAASISMSEFNRRIDVTPIDELVEMSARLSRESSSLRSELAHEVALIRIKQKAISRQI